MGVMQQCIDDLLTSEELDPAIAHSLSRDAEPIQQQSWAISTQKDYPTDLERE